MSGRLEETSGHLCVCFQYGYGLRPLFGVLLVEVQSEGIELGKIQSPTTRAV